MGRTPDRYPGVREEEAILLADLSASPTDPYSLARVNGAIEGVDTEGTFNPRDGDTLKGLPVSGSSPSAGDVLTWNGTIGEWQPQPAGVASLPWSSEETRNGAVSTGSGSPQLAAGMSITLPSDGNYIAWFSARGESSSNNGEVFVDLALDGVKLDFSERSQTPTKKNKSLNVATHSRFAATSGQVVTARYWSGGGNSELTGRTLTVLRVG